MAAPCPLRVVPPIAPTPRTAPGSAAAGQVFADLLLLGAMVSDAPIALVSLPRDGRWSTLWHGVEKEEQVADTRVFDFVARCQDPVEISDIAAHPLLGNSPLAAAPLGGTWLLGVPLRASDGSPLGVLCLLHREHRTLTKAQARAVRAVARQLEGHLEQWRRPATPPAAQPAVVRPAPRSGRRGGADGGLLRSHEVAAIFDVTERTVINWAASGKLPSMRTVGGHLRFRSEEVADLIKGRPAVRRPS